MSKKRILLVIMILAALCVFLAACGGGGSNNAAPGGNNSSNEPASNDAQPEAPVADGTYSVKFDTDSSMFHVNEAHKGRGTLTVKDGKMTLHVALTSKNIVNLFAGLAEDAQKDGAKILEPVAEKVKYSDGYEEEAYAFDIPVPWLDEEFDCAILGTKGKWYDHKVSVSDPQPVK